MSVLVIVLIVVGWLLLMLLLGILVGTYIDRAGK